MAIAPPLLLANAHKKEKMGCSRLFEQPAVYAEAVYDDFLQSYASSSQRLQLNTLLDFSGVPR
jgi:hypothetical protein